MITILSVDDNKQVRDILTPMLKMWLKKNAVKGTIIEKNNGAEFLRQTALQDLDLRPKTLVLTGYADDLEEQLGTDALLMKHLRKPFTLTELFSAVDSLYQGLKD